MARASVDVYCHTDNGEKLVRSFGGNKSDVLLVARHYRNITKEQFLTEHPRFLNVCNENFGIELRSSWSTLKNF